MKRDMRNKIWNGVRLVFTVVLATFLGCAVRPMDPDIKNELSDLREHIMQLHVGMLRNDVEGILGKGHVIFCTNLAIGRQELYAIDTYNSHVGVWLNYGTIKWDDADQPVDTLSGVPTIMSINNGGKWKNINVAREAEQ